MKIGFTGTRVGMSTHQLAGVHDVLRCLCPSEAHHGDCVGSDAQFHSSAQHVAFNLGYKVKIVVHPPSNSTHRANVTGDDAYAPKPYLERNKWIVDKTQLLIATPAGPEVQRSGTWSTIRYARSRNRPIIILWPDGRRTSE